LSFRTPIVLVAADSADVVPTSRAAVNNKIQRIDAEEAAPSASGASNPIRNP
jgi:hypothetical protein